MADGVRRKTVPRVQLDDTSKGQRTRERLLDLAYESMIAKGLAATSVEELVAAAGITKSGFFYHFKDKHELARQVLSRYSAVNQAGFDRLSRRARELSDDPLQSFLIFLRLFAEDMEESVEAAPGCLVATVAFQERSFAHDVRLANTEMVRAWRGWFLAWLEEIVLAYRPNVEVDVELLADAGWASIFGAFTLAKTTGPTSVVSGQVLLYRETVRRAFHDGGAGPRFAGPN